MRCDNFEIGEKNEKHKLYAQVLTMHVKISTSQTIWNEKLWTNNVSRRKRKIFLLKLIFIILIHGVVADHQS